MRCLVLSLPLLALAACSNAPPGAAPHPAPRPAAVDRSEKPSAPVAVAIADRDLGSGDHELTLTATPSRDVDALDLTLDGHRLAVGPTAAGQARTLTVRVHLAAGDGRDVVGDARVSAAGQRRNRAAVARVGAPRVEAPTHNRIVTMPDGTVVEEVRP